MSTQNDVKTPTSAAMRAAERIECDWLTVNDGSAPKEAMAAIIDAEFAPLLHATDALAEAAGEIVPRVNIIAGYGARERFRKLVAAYRERRGV